MRATCCPLLFRGAAAAVVAAVPPNYSNLPYKKEENSRVDREEDALDDGRAGRPMRKKKDSTQLSPSSSSSPSYSSASSSSFFMSCAADVVAFPVASTRARAGHDKLSPSAVLPPPAPMRSTFINPSASVTSFNSNYKIKSFRHAACGCSDVSMRPLQFLAFTAATTETATMGRQALAMRSLKNKKSLVERANSFGERLRDQLSCRWAAKFYGQVTYGPRNFPYPSSRWLARRFKMKKHKIVKRFRFRRYKLAAVANLPFAKMIRVGMLPELKSSKTKKGDAVDAGLSAQLVSATKSAQGGKTKGKRSRPKSKYQV